LIKSIRKYVDWAGGPSEVAKQLKLSRTTVWRWYKIGFPHTDFSGQTSHAKTLARLCQKNGYDIDFEKILKAGRP